MTGTNRLSWILRGSAMLAFGATLAGCGGISPGDYVIYDVAQADAVKSGGCFPNGEVDANTSHSSDDGIAMGQWVITAGPNDEFYLDTGGKGPALQGELSSDTYDFHETNTQVMFDGDVTTGTKRTTKIATDVSITTDGETITGTATVKTSYSCSGNTCGNPQNSCTLTTDFSGSKIDDVKLQHDPG